MVLKRIAFLIILALFAIGYSPAWGKDRGEKGRGNGKAHQYSQLRDKDDRTYKNRRTDRDDDGDRDDRESRSRRDRDNDRDDYGWGDRDVRDRIRYNGIDSNGDGVITRREWPGNDQSFRQHDWNGDGVLSGAELRKDSKRLKRDRDRDDSYDLPDFVRRR